MDDPSKLVPLPPSVDLLISQICEEQNQKPPPLKTREKLASLGEEGALKILGIIKPKKIMKSLSAFINHLLKEDSPKNSPSFPPQKKLRLSPSPSPSPQRRLSSSPSTFTVALYPNPQGKAEAVARSLFKEAPRDSRDALLEALGGLEFRKQFLILVYSGGKDLGSIMSVDSIRNWKHLPMVEFERRLWEDIGRDRIERKDRQQHHDWDLRRTHEYHCHVSANGICKFKGPCLSKTRTHLQKVLGDDNVLLVKFEQGETRRSDIGQDGDYYHFKFRREGIPVGLRRYRFFVFKDGGKEEKKKDSTSSTVKCYFVRFESKAQIDQSTSTRYLLSDKTVHEARCMFMHAHTVSSVAKYMARFSLVLSKTLTVKVDLSMVKIERVEDEYCLDESNERIYRDGKPLILTDGTGYISEDLALRCPKNLSKGECLVIEDIEMILNPDECEDTVSQVQQLGGKNEEPPLLMQFRLFNNGLAVKGTFLVNKKLEPNTMVIRDSMVKVEIDPLLKNQTANSLEVVGTSNAPRKSYLSKNLIALLSYGGVPDDFFLRRVDSALTTAHAAFTNKRAALRVSINYGGMDDNYTLARMILAGIPLEESYLQHRLFVLTKEEFKSLRGGKLYVPDCYYLMGTVDPTGKLKKDEVCIVLENGQLSGKVLVYRNPGLHFGDIHVLKATYIEELESFVGNSKYAIFFPSTGPRSIADEIGTGDFDGDMYWVSRNSQMLEHFKPSEPWGPPPPPTTPKVPTKSPKEFLDRDPEELEDELFKLFLTTRFQPSFTIGEAADCWMALMDRFLTLGDDNISEKDCVRVNIIKLINIYYDALDAPKQGGPKIEVPKELKVEKFPHYMEKKNSYTSKSILGAIYDRVDNYQSEDHTVEKIWKLPCFDIEVPEPCYRKWKDYYDQYREEMSVAMDDDGKERRNEKADEIIREYKKRLYGVSGELEESERNMEEIFNEALAIYNVTYDYAMTRNSVKLCSFAWKVAGSALFKLYISQQLEEKPLQCLASVLREIF